MIKLQVILGSTRPGRVGEGVARWAHATADARTDVEAELIDIAHYSLPLLDEPIPPSQHRYSKDHTKRWAQKIAQADAYLFVTAEYNHGIPAALKNAIDFLYAEWNNKTAGFVSYGSAGGARAVEHLRGVMGEIRIADVREQLMLYFDRDFENGIFKPQDHHGRRLNLVIDEVVAWGRVMKETRERLAQ